MVMIPFPPPHDTDALNDFLDLLIAGEKVHPKSSVEDAAQELHKLAAPTILEPDVNVLGKSKLLTTSLARPRRKPDLDKLGNETRANRSNG